MGIAVILWAPYLLKKCSFYTIGKQTSDCFALNYRSPIFFLRTGARYPLKNFSRWTGILGFHTAAAPEQASDLTNILNKANLAKYSKFETCVRGKNFYFCVHKCAGRVSEIQSFGEEFFKISN